MQVSSFLCHTLSPSRLDNKGRRSARSGSPWKPGLGGSSISCEALPDSLPTDIKVSSLLANGCEAVGGCLPTDAHLSDFLPSSPPFPVDFVGEADCVSRLASCTPLTCHPGSLCCQHFSFFCEGGRKDEGEIRLVYGIKRKRSLHQRRRTCL